MDWRKIIDEWINMDNRPKRLVCVIKNNKEFTDITNTSNGSFPVKSMQHEWELEPHKYQLIADTSNKLTSCALNRGLGVHKFDRSVFFGLLNNDVIWRGHLSTIHNTLAGMRQEIGAFNAPDKEDMSISINDHESSMNFDNGAYGTIFERKYYRAPKLWLSLSKHHDDTVNFLMEICNIIKCGYEKELLNAARFHDWGKAHPLFQEAFLSDKHANGKNYDIWAKRRPRVDTPSDLNHDLLGGTAMMSNGMNDLECYLVMTHHGKYRKTIPDVNDQLPQINLGGGITTKETTINVKTEQYKKLVSRLIRNHGMFKLAFYETLLRSADRLASKKADADAKPNIK